VLRRLRPETLAAHRNRMGELVKANLWAAITVRALARVERCVSMTVDRRFTLLAPVVSRRLF